MNSMIVDRLLGDCMARQLIHLRYNGFTCRLNSLSSSAITIQNSWRAHIYTSPLKWKRAGRGDVSGIRTRCSSIISPLPLVSWEELLSIFYTKFQIPTNNSYPNHKNPLITQYSLISPKAIVKKQNDKNNKPFYLQQIKWWISCIMDHISSSNLKKIFLVITICSWIISNLLYEFTKTGPYLPKAFWWERVASDAIKNFKS